MEKQTYAVLSPDSFDLGLGVVGKHHRAFLGRFAAHLVRHLLNGLSIPRE